MLQPNLLIFMSLMIFQGYSRTLLVKTEESLEKKTKPSLDIRIGKDWNNDQEVGEDYSEKDDSVGRKDGDEDYHMGDNWRVHNSGQWNVHNNDRKTINHRPSYTNHHHNGPTNQQFGNNNYMHNNNVRANNVGVGGNG